MRVTSDFWVSALLRRVFGAGGFAAVVNRGATEAGAVFVLARGRLGEVALYGPAPQTSYDSAKPDDRFFVNRIIAEDLHAQGILYADPAVKLSLADYKRGSAHWNAAGHLKAAVALGNVILNTPGR